jgi:hypothetical protein
MFAFVKSLSTKINSQMQMIGLVVLSMIGLYLYLGGADDVLEVTQNLLPIILILGAVWLLFLNKKPLAAHAVLFLVVFANGLNAFINWLFSYHFFFEDFIVNFSINTVMILIACVYLGAIIMSYLLTDGFKVELKNPGHSLLLLLFALYIYLDRGFNALLIVSLYVFLAFNAKQPVAALSLMLCNIITVPFIVVRRFIDEAAKFTTIHDWIMDAFALFLIYLIIVSLLPSLKKPKELIEPKQA